MVGSPYIMGAMVNYSRSFGRQVINLLTPGRRYTAATGAGERSAVLVARCGVRVAGFGLLVDGCWFEPAKMS